MCLGLGTLLAVVPLVFYYLLCRPLLVLLDFAPLHLMLRELSPTLFLGNAVLLSSLALVVGAAFLALGKRTGYALTVGASGFTLAFLGELLLGLLVMGNEAAIEAAQYAYSEIRYMTGVLPFLVLGLQIAALVLLNMRGALRYLHVSKKTVWAAVVLGALLLADLNLSFLLRYMLSE